MGDPEASFSISRQLETMLDAAYPKIHFEVVNAGITAINSHVVRGIAADCAELEPDLYVVYEGNNEVIGPFGPATVFTPVLANPMAIRAAVFLRGLRTGQAMSGLARRSAKGKGVPEDWGGMQMFLQHEIAADDPRLATTAALFEDNLRAIAHAGSRAGATVVFGTVLTNQKDFSPFQSRHRVGLTPEQIANWEKSMKEGSEAANTADWVAAEHAYRAALQMDDAFAETHFQLARVLLKQNRATEAKVEYQRALDLDTLRFRTDLRLNEAIRQVSADPSVHAELADFVKEAEAESPNGILGDEFLYEHVHLSFRGTYLIARSLFRHVTEDLRRRGRLGAEDLKVQPITMDEVRTRLAFTTYEQALIGKEMLARLRRPPFTSQSTNNERVLGYERRDARATQILGLPESADGIFSVYERALAANPSDWILHRNYGMALTAFRQPARAKPHLLAALETIPDDPDTLYGLILVHRALNETTEASLRTEQLRKIAPNYPGLEKPR